MANIGKNIEKTNIRHTGKRSKQCDYLLFVSSNREAEYISQNFASNGFLAVSMTKDPKEIEKSYLNGKKTPFKRIFVLGNDKTQVESLKSSNFAQKMGLVWLDCSMAKNFFNFPQKWGILDIKGNSSKLLDFIMFCIGSNDRVNSYLDDPSSIEVPHCYKIHFNQYIGEQTPNQFGISPIGFIHHLIKYNQRLMIQSNAGTGKSTLMKLLVNQSTIPRTLESQKFIKSIIDLKTLRENAGIERVIIAEPTTAIGSQLAKSFMKSGLNVTCIDNNSSFADLMSADYNSVIICCYDSIRKIPHLIDNKTLVVVDEFHQLPIDIEYRNDEAFTFLIDQIENAGRALFLSATPDYFFTMPKILHPSFGYKLLKGEASIQNKITLIPKIYDGRRMDTLGYLIENEPQGNGSVLCKFDSISNLQTACKALEKKGLLSDYLCSRIRSQKEGNEHYRNIVDNNKFKSFLHYLFYTTLMEAGVSIESPIKLNALIDTIGWRRAIQLFSRSRYNSQTGTNKAQTVWFFRSLKNIKEKNQIVYKTPIIKRFKEKYNLALNICEVKNTLDKDGNFGEYKHKTKADEIEHSKITYFDESEQKYKPCLLWILRKIHEQALQVPFSLTLKRIERFDNRVEVMPFDYIKLDAHPLFEEIRDEQKAAKEAQKEQLKNLFLTDLDNLIAAICLENKNRGYTDKINGLFDGAAKILPIQAKSFASKYEQLLRLKSAKRTLDRIYFIRDYNKTFPLKSLVKMVINEEPKIIDDAISQIGRYNRSFDYKHDNNLSQDDKFSHEREAIIIKRINEMKRDDNKYKKTLSGSKKDNGWKSRKQLSYLINSALKKWKPKGGNVSSSISETKAVTTIKDLFHVEQRRSKKRGKKTTLFKIGERRKIAQTNTKLDILLSKYRPQKP